MAIFLDHLATLLPNSQTLVLNNIFLTSGKNKRSELFVVTKLPFIAMRAEDVESYLAESLRNLQLDYVDLYIIHLPLGVAKDPNKKWYPKLDNEKVRITAFSWKSNSDVNALCGVCAHSVTT